MSMPILTIAISIIVLFAVFEMTTIILRQRQTIKRLQSDPPDIDTSDTSNEDDLTLNIVHDFNNAIAAIMGYNEILQDDLNSTTPDPLLHKRLTTQIMLTCEEAQREIDKTETPFPDIIKNAHNITQLHHGNILIVEDDIVTANTLAHRLEKLGYETLHCVTGEEALELLSNQHDFACDLVLTDHQMPGMTGIELAHSLSVEHPHLPIIMLSGYKKDKILNAVKNTNTKAVLKKSITTAKLSFVIQDCLTTKQKAV